MTLTRSSAARIAAAGVCAVFLTGLTACSDGTGPDADLTQEQAEKVAQAVSQSAYQQDFTSSGSASMDASKLSPSFSQQVWSDTTISLSTSGQGPCQGGGSVNWSVTIDAYQSQARDSAAVDGTLMYDGCTTTVDSSTVTLSTVEDSPFEYAATLVQSSVDSTVEWSSGLSGGVDWSLEGESGTCTIALETDITVTGVGSTSQGSIDAVTSGEVCDRTIERNFSLQSSTGS